MLSVATIGLAGYGLYETGHALFDLLSAHRLEVWANLVAMLFGLLLLPAAVFVRIQFPGGLALAVGALLGLQAMGLHSAAHFYGRVALLPQVARAIFAGMLIVFAYLGDSRDS